MKKSLFISCILLLISNFTSAGKIYTEFPSQVDANQKYVFYSHGLILEGNIDTPINPKKPQWGMYDFPNVKEQLSDNAYNLIAYHRPKNTDKYEYAHKLKHDVEHLIRLGVKAENISLIGFSRGGEITLLASNALKNEKINYVILAACLGDIERDPNIKLYGRVLSIYETSDEVGSCKTIQERSPRITSFTEKAITTNQQHGAFFRPNQIWIEPIKTWINAF
ncbi:alpha/beta hydrolase [Acinetobacter sp. ANC 4558]|uniref:alpha/beta hydrolase n=1 Tax=Acinetobacter sp. ANC 4558 TaxID=1977876 RepID=UPI000A341A9F|nr:alpha/beta hydrolase [Acinetobacter sp. ANC 4558]OTG87133.1 alpha/beta hydrolase [Acinetobacter sp. ANC 4558]